MSALATATQLVMGALVMLLPAGEAEAAGSWVATAPAVRAVMVEREVASAPLTAPAGPAAADTPAGRIDSVVWQYRTAPGQAVHARLCHADGCLPLPGGHGTSQALAGLPAGTPLHFRFSLAPGQRGAVTVQGLQVIVNYR
ncbi:flagellar protein FlhE [Halomonas campaniensis]|uniref:flagellar protein FlhE n=1 Tax=Halomonas campaniensis TaxID=213554 RepID=UPI003970A1E1